MEQNIRLSPSSLINFLHCPRLFYYSNILKLPRTQTGRMVVGRVIHRTLSLAYKHMFSGEMMPFDDVIVLFNKLWDWELRTKTLWDADPEEAKSMARTLIESYYHELMPKYTPVASEQKYETIIGDVTYVGVIDLEFRPTLFGDDDVRIADIKIRKRRLDQKSADKDIQATSYGLLKGKPVTFEFHVGLMQKKPSWDVVITKRNNNDYEFLSNMVKQAHDLIAKTGEFIPNTSFWGCSEFDEEKGTGCEFYDVCHLF